MKSNAQGHSHLSPLEGARAGTAGHYTSGCNATCSRGLLPLSHWSYRSCLLFDTARVLAARDGLGVCSVCGWTLHQKCKGQMNDLVHHKFPQPPFPRVLAEINYWMSLHLTISSRKVFQYFLSESWGLRALPFSYDWGWPMTFPRMVLGLLPRFQFQVLQQNVLSVKSLRC